MPYNIRLYYKLATAGSRHHGIMAGCTISPLAFTMAMEIIIRASKWVVGGERLQCNQRLPPIRAYMEDLTTLTTTVPCTKRLLEKLHQNITWARMKLKPSKCRSISIVKGQVTDQRFHVGGTPVPTVSEMPVKSLGRWYDAKLKDTEQFEHLKNDTKTLLPGKLKLWCFQFGILPRLLWPLTVYEIPITKVGTADKHTAEAVAWNSTLFKFCRTLWTWQVGITNHRARGRVQMHQSKARHDPN